MKGFYSATEAAVPPSVALVEDGFGHKAASSARIAVYDSPAAAPRIEEVAACETTQYIERLSARIYELAREAGGSTPYTVLREVAENLIHADFCEPVISIMESGSVIRVSDQGPGIPDKSRAIEPGFTTAHGQMKRHIRGVGSGLPLVKEFLAHSGGTLSIEDNLTGGAVVTLCVRREASPQDSGHTLVVTAADLLESRPAIPVALDALADGPASSKPQQPVRSRLSTRQKKVLALVTEASLAGPSQIAKELAVGVSTAYRDLSFLEALGLLVQVEGGKREVTEEGIACLNDLMRNS